MFKAGPSTTALSLLTKQPLRLQATGSRLTASKLASTSTARLYSSNPLAIPSLTRTPFSLAQLRTAQPLVSASRLASPISLRAFSTAPTQSNPPLNPAPAGGASPPPNPDSAPNAEQQTVAQKLRGLFRTHGWSALVVYLLLSALDFGLTFAVIYVVGADRVREAEDYVLDALEWRRKDGEPGRVKRAVTEWSDKRKSPEKLARDEEKREQKRIDDERKKQEDEHHGADKSAYGAIASTAVLAYVIHKTALLPVRVGVTVAITPKVVRQLQRWG